MEVYILDQLNRRDRVIDRFESLIWTERWQAFGDFELVLYSSLENRELFQVGTRISINSSMRVMEVETTEDIRSSDGKATLRVKGTSLEDILNDRVAKESLSDTTTSPKWSITDVPGDVARKIFHDICVTGILNDGDIILGITEDNVLFPDDTIEESTDTVTISFPPTTVYNAVKQVCEVYDLGFRIVRDPVSNLLYWDVYAGSDRTTAQDDLGAVIFSPDLDNLENTTELTTTALYKNVAYVFSPVGVEVVYPDTIDPDIAGFDRRVLMVDASDITEPTGASAALIQRGKEALAGSRQLSAFDGELNRNVAYKYGLDYNLGDLIEMRNVDGVTNYMRVSEQIFVSDAEGERSYPTLTISQFIMPGTWLAWDYNQVWDDYDLDPTAWDDL